MFWMPMFTSAGIQLKQAGSNEMHFIENKGQWSSEVLFLARLHGLNAWITKSGVTYDHFMITQIESRQNFAHLPPHEKEQAESNNYSIRGHVVKLAFMDANENPSAQGDMPATAVHNYFLGNDPDKWATGVSLYGQVDLDQVVDGISVKYYFDRGNLRYDYHVLPGADVGNLRFRLEGPDEWQINDAGELEIGTSLGIVNHGKIYAYQHIGGEEQEVTCSFVRLPDGSLGMTVGDYDPALPLIIDPMVFSTYLGGNGYESNPAVALGADGSVYVTGHTSSSNFPVTPGAYQTTKKADHDIIISKMDASASALLFSTFLGGDGRDELPDISLGTDGTIFITGTTESPNFPVTFGVVQPNYPDGKTIFITRLNAEASALIFSTYLGGNNDDYGNSIVTDIEGNAYVSGYSYSEDFPVTPGTLNNGTLFVTKINPTGSALIFSALVAPAQGLGMDIDNSGKIYVTGYLYYNSPGFPITPGAFQPIATGYFCSFVTVINPTASQILASTYLTGDYQDFGRVIRVAENGDIIVGGSTDSQDFPTTSNAFQPISQGNSDIFVTRLNASCTQMIWGTLLGTSDGEELFGMALDEDENVVITGRTGSGAQFPVTTDEFVVNMPSLFLPAYISQISNDGSQLIYSALLVNDDFIETNGFDVVVNDGGNFILVGNTGDGFPITSGVFQPNFGGGWVDFFISEIIPFNCQAECQVNIINNVSCFGGSDGKAQALPSGGIEPYTYLWSDGQTTQIAENLAPGSYNVTITDAIGCTAEAYFGITQPTQIQVTNLEIWPASCAGSPDGSATVQAGGGTSPYTYLWGNGETGNTATALLPGDNHLTITDSKDCEKVVNFYVGYIPPFNNEVICAVSYAEEPGLNQVVWQKTEGVRTIAYNIYRESGSTGNYQLIGTTPFDEPGKFLDETANPGQQSFSYKIAVVDSCGAESALSPHHKSMHLSLFPGTGGSINLLWSLYEGFSFTTFYVMRSVENSPYQMIGQLPSTNFSFSDINPPFGLKKYMIQIDAPENCGLPGMRVNSNVVIDQEVGIGSQDMDLRLIVVPNPGDGIFNIQFPDGFRGQKVNVQVLNSLGGCISETALPAAGEDLLIDISGQPAGVYLFKTQSPAGVFVESVVKWK
jgi:hypothetical protein